MHNALWPAEPSHHVGGYLDTEALLGDPLDRVEVRVAVRGQDVEHDPSCPLPLACGHGAQRIGRGRQGQGSGRRRQTSLFVMVLPTGIASGMADSDLYLEEARRDLDSQYALNGTLESKARISTATVLTVSGLIGVALRLQPQALSVEALIAGSLAAGAALGTLSCSLAVLWTRRFEGAPMIELGKIVLDGEAHQEACLKILLGKRYRVLLRRNWNVLARKARWLKKSQVSAVASIILYSVLVFLARLS